MDIRIIASGLLLSAALALTLAHAEDDVTVEPAKCDYPIVWLPGSKFMMQDGRVITIPKMLPMVVEGKCTPETPEVEA